MQEIYRKDELMVERTELDEQEKTWNSQIKIMNLLILI